MTELILALIGAALVNNIALQHLLAIDPLLRRKRGPCGSWLASDCGGEPTIVIAAVRRPDKPAPTGFASRLRLHALGLATLVAMLLVSVSGQLLYRYALQPLQLDYLRLFVFLPLCVLGPAPILAGLQRWLKGWPFTSLQPLLTGNAALLGLCLQLSGEHQGVLHAAMVGLGSGLGFWLVLALFDDLRQRSQHEDVPRAFRGLPIELMGAGIMAMAFLGFNGLFAS
ncbi:NADH:quinone oxidoreductase [Pseudomonas sp. GD04058]|uniref:Rnf-Nqr domain containing protein n=1 Tax=Pseudomonas sp. GD04058 TaxID=2975429 RepID=UPI002447ACA2|nr:Rnf-Nqr domain containing protein [Pseudomonas sp. GD04058]MDG9885458.1 NADH:quinone oxidoreductase [Pseudomonas sp. GD04058]